MSRLAATILFAAAIGTFGLTFDKDEPLSNDVRYPADLIWLFEGNNQRTTKNDVSRSVCETDECKKIAHALKESMNDSVDPCDNFYEYACGNWPEHNPIPEGKAVWNLLYIVAEKVGLQIIEILKEDLKPDDILPLKLARRLYHSCMDLEGMERRGLEPLVITLARGNGWPMIMLPEEWDEEETNWQNVDHYYGHLTGTFTFFHFGLFSDANSTVQYASIKPSLFLTGASLLVSEEGEEETNDSDGSEQEDSQEQGSKEKVPDNDNKKDDDNNEGEDILRDSEEEKQEAAYRKMSMDKKPAPSPEALQQLKVRYKEFVIKVALAISKTRGFPVTEEMIAKDVEDLMVFVAKVYKIMRNTRSKEDDDDLMSIKEIQEWYDSLGHDSTTTKINWLNTLSVVFHDANVEIDENFVMHFPQKAFFEKIANLLEETSARTLVNFVHWKVIVDLLEATTEEMRTLVYNISSPLVNREESSEEEKYEMRKLRCLYEVKALSIVGYEYVKRHFNEKNMEATRDMVKEIQSEVENQIMKSEWMDNNTRMHALNKVKNMYTLIGYPSWYNNATLMNNYYKGIVVSPSHFENALTYEKHSQWKMLRQVNKKKENNTMTIDIHNPAEVNAFYAGGINAIMITAADLQGPFFELSRPAAINFGVLGLIIGHEINHGFDSTNFKYDDKGAVALSIMADSYNRRAGCFVEQYNNFMATIDLFNGTIEDYGNQTSSENIADSMGLFAVYYAYKNHVKKSSSAQQTLPGFESFSDDQLFFLSFANMWCEIINPEKGFKKFKADGHSPGMFRVLGPLSNSVEFANAYNCPAGSPMNPNEKCNIWNL